MQRKSIMKKKLKHKNFLIFTFLLSFIFSSVFFYFFLSKDRDYWRGDTFYYHDVAVQIVKGNGITYQGETSYYRVPGYSIFLAFCYKLFNFDEKKTGLFQIFFSSFIPILVFFLSLVFFPTNILLAKACAIGMALNLGTMLYAGFLISYTIFLFFL